MPRRRSKRDNAVRRDIHAGKTLRMAWQACRIHASGKAVSIGGGDCPQNRPLINAIKSVWANNFASLGKGPFHDLPDQ